MTFMEKSYIMVVVGAMDSAEGFLSPLYGTYQRIDLNLQIARQSFQADE